MGTIENDDGRFTNQQKDLLRETWKGVWHKDVKIKFSVDVFKNLFTAHPEIQELFYTMKDVTDIEILIKSPKLKGHALRVVSAINNLVENLDEPEIFVDMIKHLARSHRRNNVSKQHFDKLGLILVNTMEEYLGEQMTPKAIDAWVAAYSFIVESVWGEYQAMDETDELSNGKSH